MALSPWRISLLCSVAAAAFCAPQAGACEFHVAKTGSDANPGSLQRPYLTAGQTIEDACGRPIRVDTDLFGQRRAVPVAGPLADPKVGENALDWSIIVKGAL